MAVPDRPPLMTSSWLDVASSTTALWGQSLTKTLIWLHVCPLRCALRSRHFSRTMSRAEILWEFGDCQDIDRCL